MASGEKFCLRWNDFESNISTAFREIRDEKDLFDCTLSCGPKQLQAHKLILSACSPFFREIFKQNPHQHPLLYLKGIGFEDLKSCLNFMYHGEVNVAQDDLNTFLVVAEELKIKGLTQNNGEKEHSKKDVTIPAALHRPPAQISPPKSEPFPKRARITPAAPVQPAVDDDIVEVEPEVKTEPAHEVAVAAMAEEGYEEENYDYGEYNPETVEYDGGLMEQGDSGKDLLDERERVASLVLYHGNQSYSCAQCGKEATRKGDLMRHIVSKHVTVPACVCPLCNRQYKNQNSLTNHISLQHRS